MGDGAPRIPIVGEPTAKKARGTHALASTVESDAMKTFKRDLRERHITKTL